MKIVSQNILDIKSGIATQCVNAMGVFGSGLALQIKNKWPQVYQKYKNDLLMPRYKNLGRAQIIHIENDLFCCNLYSQLDYGTDYRRTEYGSLYLALKNLKKQKDLKEIEDHKEREIYFPWQLASGRGGADWNLVMEMLDELFPNCNICKIN